MSMARPCVFYHTKTVIVAVNTVSHLESARVSHLETVRTTAGEENGESTRSDFLLGYHVSYTRRMVSCDMC